MKFGIWAPQPHVSLEDEQIIKVIHQLETVNAGPCASYELIRDTLIKAEQCGFTSSLIAERWLGPDLEAWILASALAVETEKLELIVAVHPGIITPQAVAKMSLSLDRISGGRAAINIVNGWWEQEFNLFSNGAWLENRAERFDRMEEFIQTLKGIWSGGQQFNGEYYQLQNEKITMKTAKQTLPRIYAASQSPRGKQIIASTSNVWFLAYEGGVENADKNMQLLKQEIVEMQAIDTEKNLEYAISAFVICEDSYEEAIAKAKQLEHYAEVHGGVAKVAVQSLGAGLVGTPQMIADKIHEYEEIGIDQLMLRFNPTVAGLERFAKKIMPLMKKDMVRS